jgi:hypothetical protein
MKMTKKNSFYLSFLKVEDKKHFIQCIFQFVFYYLLIQVKCEKIRCYICFGCLLLLKE